MTLRAAAAFLAAGALLAPLGCQDAKPLATGLPDPATVGCSACHGDAASPAPPRSVKGDTSTEVVDVGAHRLHLRDTAVRKAIACSECHVVPAAVEAPGHVDSPHATLAWGPLASAGSAAPGWDRDAATCSGVYCHGATLSGGTAKAPVWTFAVEPDPARPRDQICGTCHGNPPSAPHPQMGPCSACHPGTVRAGGAIDVDGGLHVNGAVEHDTSLAACGACHPVPGASGAHAAHYADASATPLATYGDVRIWADYQPVGVAGYLFGCGNCHPLDPAKHMDGAVEVELHADDAPAGSLKARNGVVALWLPSGSSGTCVSTYCHGSGKDGIPVASATPPWDSGRTLGCASCHTNPPSYPSGPAGSATANTHLVARSNVYNGTTYVGGYGHFTWHNKTSAIYSQPGSGKHGMAGEGAAPMTCQACHYETVDPANTAPGGSFYLDTTGSYSVPGQNYLAYSCTYSGSTFGCHGGQPGAPPQGSGKALPRRHVNGVPDVVFDPRIAPPPTGVYGVPLDPDAPAYPYWVGGSQLNVAEVLPPGASRNGSTVSFELSAAGYDPSNRTCSSVSCHLQQASATWGGTGLGTFGTCFDCHSVH